MPDGGNSTLRYVKPQEGEVDPGLLGFVMQTTGNFLVGSKVLSSAVMLPDLLLLATNSKYIR